MRLAQRVTRRPGEILGLLVIQDTGITGARRL